MLEADSLEVDPESFVHLFCGRLRFRFPIGLECRIGFIVSLSALSPWSFYSSSHQHSDLNHSILTDQSASCINSSAKCLFFHLHPLNIHKHEVLSLHASTYNTRPLISITSVTKYRYITHCLFCNFSFNFRFTSSLHLLKLPFTWSYVMRLSYYILSLLLQILWNILQILFWAHFITHDSHIPVHHFVLTWCFDAVTKLDKHNWAEWVPAHWILADNLLLSTCTSVDTFIRLHQMCITSDGLTPSNASLRSTKLQFVTFSRYFRYPTNWSVDLLPFVYI